MRDPKRIEEILTLLKFAWEHVPDWRLCQLLSNCASQVGKEGDLFYWEDDILLEVLKASKKYIEDKGGMW